jgi:hypothetical protein
MRNELRVEAIKAGMQAARADLISRVARCSFFVMFFNWP